MSVDVRRALHLALWAVAWAVLFLALMAAMACQPVDDPHSDDRPLTTQVNPCGEPGVCEGS